MRLVSCGARSPHGAPHEGWPMVSANAVNSALKLTLSLVRSPVEWRD